MSDAGAVQAGPGTRPALHRNVGARLSPLEALEQGFALFRSTFNNEGWRYYIGSVPLVLCFIPIWVINGQIRNTDGALFLQAGLLAVLYLFRVTMVGKYMRRIRERAFGTPGPVNARMFVRGASFGRLCAWKALLGIAALTVLPTVAGASWFYGACQFASLEAQADDAERHSLSDCLSLSSRWFGGGLLLFLMLVPLWSAVWLNAVIVAIVLPQLLHSVLGVDTVLSTQMGILSLIQSSAFWLSLFAGAWLALDPIAKCAYVIAYQYLRSRREGDDLRGAIAQLPREQQKRSEFIASEASVGKMKGVALLLSLAMMGSAFLGRAQATQVPPTGNGATTAGDVARDARISRLRTAIDQQSQRAIYRWHDSDHPSPPTWFDKLLARIGRSIKNALDRVWKFLHKLWPRGWQLSPGTEKQGGWKLQNVRVWIGVLALLTLAAGAVLFWFRRRSQAVSLSVPQEIMALPVLSETAVASDRSEEEWFTLAGELERSGELRFALRAAYLGLLAGLAQREWLTIRRDRTNREYLHEFTRRWRRRPQAAMDARAEVPERFHGSLREFDEVWYGEHEVTSAGLSAYCREQREFLSHV